MNQQDIEAIHEAYCNKDITIARLDFEKLFRASRLLDCLMEAGVDNWEGYDQAMQTFNENE